MLLGNEAKLKEINVNKESFKRNYKRSDTNYRK